MIQLRGLLVCTVCSSDARFSQKRFFLRKHWFCYVAAGTMSPDALCKVGHMQATVNTKILAFGL